MKYTYKTYQQHLTMKTLFKNKKKLLSNLLQIWKTLLMKMEIKVSLLLMILTILGIVYHIVSRVTDNPHAFVICPLCEKPANEPKITTFTF